MNANNHLKENGTKLMYENSQSFVRNTRVTLPLGGGGPLKH
jgi:hypothetical protein